METLGSRLKKIRLEKGLHLEEVQKKTKIHINILRAIEEDEHINLSPVYLKGFLKIYCKFLGVNPQDYLSDYQETGRKLESVSPKVRKPIAFIKTASTKLSSFRLPINKRVLFSVFALVIVTILTFRLGKWVSLKLKSASQKGITSLPPKSQKLQTAVKPVKPRTPLGNTQKGVFSGIRLTIHAREDCYIQLMKTDGRINPAVILRKGRSETWLAKEKIEFSVGNAGAVELEVNGKLISNLGRRGQALKNITVTREGLSVPR